MRTNFSVVLATLLVAIVTTIGEVDGEVVVSYRIRESKRKERVAARRREKNLINADIASTDQKHRLALGLVKREFEIVEEQHNLGEGARELFMTTAHAALTDHEHRNAVRYTLSFDECEGKTLEECQRLIDEVFEADPSLFHGSDSIHFQVDHLQQPDDPYYYVVGIVTNIAGTHARGWNGDGIIHFYNPKYDRVNAWCTSDEPCPDNPNHLRWIEDQCCFAIGPWDCDSGIPKTVDECCDMIQSSVPSPDVNGNKLECYAAHPLGSPEHPIDYSRVHIIVDGDNLVVGEPTNE